MASWNDPVRVATTGANIQLQGTQTIDSVAVAVSDRVLVKDQSNASENGIYVVASGPWVRAPDANTDVLMEPQMMVRVSEGAVNGSEDAAIGGTAWLLANNAPITLGSTDLYFVPSDILKQDRWGQLVNFQGNAMADGDIFAISNYLQDGQSDNPQAYLAASLAGYGGICTGVHGRNGNGSSVLPQVGVGVYADSDNGCGLFAVSESNFAIQAISGTSADTDAILATSFSPNHAALAGHNNSGGFGLWAASDNGSGEVGGIGVYARGAKYAAQFDGALQVNGDVLVTGDVILVNPSSGDIAEDFDVENEDITLEPGTVLIINEKGKLCAGDLPYDTRVAGVVSGAGDFKPAVVLQRISSAAPRSPIALLGKAFCKVDATFGSIAPGDLLTTSATRGYAMKVSDKAQALGAIIGKALACLDTGLGIIPIMVSLR